MKIVWKPLDDIRLLLGRDFIKNTNHIKFVKVSMPVFLTNKGNAASARTAKFDSSDDILTYLDKSFISTFYYYKHMFQNYQDAAGIIKSYLVVRYYAE